MTQAEIEVGDSDGAVSAWATTQRSAWQIGCVLGLGALLAIQVAYFLTAPAGLLDDGIQLVGAMLQRYGQRPNIDFDSVYPPLNVYLMSGAFRLLGESIITYHLVQLSCSVVIIAAITMGCCVLSGRTRSWPTLAFVCALLNLELPTLQAATALAWSTLATLAFLIADTRTGRPRAALLAAVGGMVALLAWTRPNFALYVIAACGLATLARALSAMQDRSGHQRWLRDAAWLAGTFSAVLALLLLLWGGPIPDLLRQILFALTKALADLVVYPIPTSLSLSAVRQSVMSGLPMALLPVLWLAALTPARAGLLGRSSLCAFAAVEAVFLVALGALRPTWLPMVAVIPVALTACHLLGVRRDTRAVRHEAFLLFLLSLQTHYILSRADSFHLFGTLPCFALLLAHRISMHEHRETYRLLLLAAAVALFPALYNVRNMAEQVAHTYAGLRAVPALLASDDRLLDQGCSACGAHIADPNELAAARFVRARTAADERVYSGLQQHGADSPNDMRLYWLMRRPAGTRAIMLLWNVTTQPDRQRAIAADLEHFGVRWAVLWKGLAERSRLDPDESLDLYIRHQFELAQTFGDFQVWKRRAAERVQ